MILLYSAFYVAYLQNVPVHNIKTGVFHVQNHFSPTLGLQKRKNKKV